MSAALKPAPARMDVAEFLTWDSGDWSGARWQLVDGEPVAMAPASLCHAAIVSELARLIGNHLVATGRPCVVMTAPGIIPRVRAGDNFRIPDLGVTCASERAGHAMADPVLPIEVLSPSNVAETRANVWTYTTIPSVREVLVVHSTRVEAEVLRRTGAEWPAAPEIVKPDEVLSLESIGFSTPLTAVYRTSGLLDPSKTESQPRPGSFAGGGMDERA